MKLLDIIKPIVVLIGSIIGVRKNSNSKGIGTAIINPTIQKNYASSEGNPKNASDVLTEIAQTVGDTTTK